MSKLFGGIRQFGYVVENIKEAMEYWTRVMGIGPWHYNACVPIEKYQYKGTYYEPYHSVALTNSGSVQIELIQTRNDAPSMYKDFKEKHGTGLQHVAFWTSRFDDDLQKAQDHGFTVIMSGEVGINGRFAYFDKEYHPGTVIELSEVLGPKGKMFDLIRQAAEGWDGTDPVRAFPNF